MRATSHSGCDLMCREASSDGDWEAVVLADVQAACQADTVQAGPESGVRPTTPLQTGRMRSHAAAARPPSMQRTAHVPETARDQLEQHTCQAQGHPDTESTGDSTGALSWFRSVCMPSAPCFDVSEASGLPASSHCWPQLQGGACAVRCCICANHNA